jgi:hypothetical protein
MRNVRWVSAAASLFHSRVRMRNRADIGVDRDPDWNIGLNHVLFPLDPWDGELRTEGQFGDTSRIGTELYQPIEPHEWLFVLPFVSYELSNVDVWRSHEHLARYDLEQTSTGCTRA